MDDEMQRFRPKGRLMVSVTLAASGALLALTGAAGAAVKIDKARFKVTVTATQSTTWSVNRRDPFETCGSAYRGSGEQTMRLATKRPASVFVLQPYDTTKGRETQGMTFYGPLWRSTLQAPVTIKRSGTMTSTPNSTNPCGDGGSGGPPPPPPAPDCGERSSAAFLGLSYFPVGSYPADPAPLTGVLRLDGPKPDVSRLYRTCPFSGDSELLISPTASLTVRKVFGSARRFTVRGRERKVYENDGTRQETTTSWTAKFRRVATGQLPRPSAGAAACTDKVDNDDDGAVDERDPDCYRTKGQSEE